MSQQYFPPPPQQYNPAPPQQYNPAPPVKTIWETIRLYNNVVSIVGLLVILLIVYMARSSTAATPPSVSRTGMLQPGGTGNSSAGSGTGITSNTPVVSPQLIKFTPPADNTNINTGSSAPSIDGASTTVVVTAPKNIVLPPPPPPPAKPVIAPPANPVIAPPVAPAPVVVVMPPPPPVLVAPTSAPVALTKTIRLYLGLNFVSDATSVVPPLGKKVKIARGGSGQLAFGVKSMKVDPGVKIRFIAEVDGSPTFVTYSFAVGQYNIPDLEKWLRGYDAISGVDGHGTLGLSKPQVLPYSIYVQYLPEDEWISLIEAQRKLCSDKLIVEIGRHPPSRSDWLKSKSKCSDITPDTFGKAYAMP
jgi:hypothetical protein